MSAFYPLEICRQQGRVQLRLRLVPMGQDVCLLLDGGDTPHIGAVCICRPPEKPQCTCLPGHRDGEIATLLASRLAAVWGCTVTALCGIHIDTITPEEIHTVYSLTETLIADLQAETMRTEENLCSIWPTC